MLYDIFITPNKKNYKATFVNPNNGEVVSSHNLTKKQIETMKLIIDSYLDKSDDIIYKIIGAAKRQGKNGLTRMKANIDALLE